MIRLKYNIWLYLLLIIFVFGITAQAMAASEEKSIVSTKFSDVGAADSNAVFINYVSQRGFINGFPDGTFHPSEGLTRAQAATVMVKAAALKTGDTGNLYKDVNAAHWAALYISAASKAGYISGFPDGTFHPDEKLTRAQAMSMLMRLCTVQTTDQLPVLEDMNSSHWAAKAMASALAAGMTGVSSDGKKVYPDAELSRAGLARALAILLTKDPGLYKAPLYGTVTDVTGNVTLLRNGIESAMKNKLSLAEGDTLKTGAKSSARVTYSDGSSTLIDANSELYVKTSTGRAYIKKDGSPGTAVDFLNVDLKKGTLFGALATKHEAESKEQSKLSSSLAALPSFKHLAANDQTAPWYKTAETKKVKVKVDMPWGVAAVRGTFIKATVYEDGTCKVSCLTGSAEVQGGSGSNVGLGQGQSSSISGEGQAAGQAAGFSADDKAAFQQVQEWVMQTAVNMDLNQGVLDTQAVIDVTVEVQDNATKETAIQTVIDALQSSGIQLNNQVIESIREQIKNLQNTETLQQQLDAAANASQSGSQGKSSNSGGGGNNTGETTSSIISVDYTSAGIYGPENAANATTITGNANVLVADVTLRNMTINGNLVLGPGIGEGDVTLNNVTVKGITSIQGGGSASVKLLNCSLATVSVKKENGHIRIVAQGSTNVGELTLLSGAKLEEENGMTGFGFSEVMTGAMSPGQTITLDGDFSAVAIDVPGLIIEVAGGSVSELNISPTAGPTTLTVASGSTIEALSVNAVATIGGDGSIASATVSVSGVTMNLLPTTLINIDTAISSLGTPPAYIVDSTANTIVGANTFIDSAMTVDTFISNLKKGDAGQTLAVYAKETTFDANQVPSQPAKASGAFMADQDILVVTAAQNGASRHYSVTVTPSDTLTMLSYQLAAGQSNSSFVTISVPNVPPKADVMFIFDLTGSMSDILNTVRSNAAQIMSTLDQTGCDVRYGVMSHMDYPGSYSSYGYNDSYGSESDYAYRLDCPLTSTRDTTTAAMTALVTGGGDDGPEDYTRPLYETYADTNVGWRFGAKRIVIAFGDSIPHDQTVNTGGDPGRDGVMFTADDLVLATVLQTMKENNEILIECHNGGYYTNWANWTAVTGGQCFQSTSADVVGNVVEAITSVAMQSEVANLSLIPSANSSWVAVNPAVYSTVATGNSRVFGMTFTIPTGTPAGVYSMVLSAMDSNDVNYGNIAVSITVPSSAEPLSLAAPLKPVDDFSNPVVGTANGTIKFTNLTLPAGAAKWQVKVGAAPFDVPNLDSTLTAPDMDNYSVGGDITTASGKHVLLVATDDSGKIKAYADITTTADMVTLTPQYGSISGHVYQNDGSTPIVGATLNVRWGENNTSGTIVANTSSGPDGSYSITNLIPGVHTVQVTAGGYTPNSTNVTISAGDNLNQDFTLATQP